MKFIWKHYVAPVCLLTACCSAMPLFASDDKPESKSTGSTKSKVKVNVEVTEGDVRTALESALKSIESIELPEEQLQSITKALGELEKELGKSAEGAKGGTLFRKNDEDPQVIDLRVMAEGLEPLRNNITIRGAVPGYRLGIACEIVSKDAADDSESASEEVVVRIVEVGPGTVAEGQLKKGDLITAADGEAINTIQKLNQAVQKAGEEDRELELKLVREGEPMTLKLKPKKSDEVSVLVDSLRMHLPQSGWVIPPGATPPMPQIAPHLFGSPSNLGAQIEELKKEVEQIRSDVSEIKEIVKGLKK